MYRQLERVLLDLLAVGDVVVGGPADEGVALVGRAWTVEDDRLGVVPAGARVDHLHIRLD